MVAVAPPRRAAREAEGVTPPPPGRRAGRSSWRDTRLLVGVLLVLLSVVVGARVVSSAGETSSWLTVRTDLPAGHVLTEADLASAGAKLDDPSSIRYYRATSRAAIVGRPLSRPVGAGTLLPADALTPGPAPGTRVVPVVVRAGRLPALQPGDRVDVYALVKGAQPGSDRVVLVVAAVEFLGGEILGSGDSSVQLRVGAPDAIRLVAASQSERVDLVRVDGAVGPAEPSVPTEAPGLGS